MLIENVDKKIYHITFTRDVLINLPWWKKPFVDKFKEEKLSKIVSKEVYETLKAHDILRYKGWSVRGTIECPDIDRLITELLEDE